MWSWSIAQGFQSETPTQISGRNVGREVSAYWGASVGNGDTTAQPHCGTV